MLATYLILLLVIIAYVVLLEHIHDVYSPDYIWVTVVVGTTLVGLAFLALALLGAFPLIAFWHLVGLNVMAGGVVIAWQIWQAVRRHREREKER